ncbi:MAG: leucine-rich repeat protein [Bacteroidaceae bacterium]|nr:leucine-rich repeat protein [Bacteroidaceae bacterium]
MKKELLLTILLVLGIMAAPVKVMGQTTSNLLPESIAPYGTYQVEGTAGVKWRVYGTNYTQLHMQSTASQTTVTNDWDITSGSTNMGVLREKITYASLSYYEGSSRIWTIGDDAFNGFMNLQSVYLPEKKSVKIGARAFVGCANLQSVNGMDYVVEIGEEAFKETKISFSELGTKATASGNIGDLAFYNCTGIQSLTINHISSIGLNAFGFCSNLYYLTLEDYVYTITNNAFAGCFNLREIHLGQNVHLASAAVFPSNLEYLNKITVSTNNEDYSGTGNCLVLKSDYGLLIGTNNSVIPNTVKYIAPNAFLNRTKLSSINIPASITKIYANAFDGCTNLKEVWCEAETPPAIRPTSFANISSDAVLYVPTLDALTAYKDAGWGTYFSEIKVGKTEKNGMIWGLIPNDAGKYTLWVKGIEELGDFSAEGGAPWSKDVDNIVAVDVKYGVKSIGSNAFSEFGTVDTEVTFSLPSSLVSIADNAFSGCKRLKSIELPNSLTTIGEGAFQNCYALESVTFAEGSQLTSIGDNAFNYCYALESIAIPNSVTSIGESAFEMCYGLVSATLSNSMETIPNSMFYECTGLKNVTIPESITTIGNEAFSDCYALESITLPNSVTTVGDNVFSYCDDLESVTLSNSMKTIPNSMFNSCTGLKNITIPESVTSIGEYAFCSCTALPEIIIPNTVTSIEEGAFYECSGLKAITIGQSVEFIGSEAFSYINRTAVITWLPYEMPELNYEDFPRGIVWRVYYIPNYPNPYARVEGFPVTITDGEVDNYEDIYEEDILLSRMEYKRTLLADSKWNALYVPFEIPVADIIDKYDVAYINDVRLYDSDNDGEIDDNGMEVEVVPVKSGTLNANTPCLIRVKKSLSTEDAAAARSMNLALETKLCPAEEKTFDCSSIYKKFAFTGVYNKRVMDVDEDFTGAFAIAKDGNWRASSSLKPFRIFLQITNRDGSPYQPTDASASIRIRVAGEDEEATGISSPEATTDNAEQVIYDLHGRRVKNPTKGIYIVNGKKTVIK